MATTDTEVGWAGDGVGAGEAMESQAVAKIEAVNPETNRTATSEALVLTPTSSRRR